MVKTRQEAIAILDHLLTVVLDVPAGNTHPIRISFIDHQIENMDDFDCLRPDDMDALSYTKTNADNTTQAVPRQLGHRRNLRHLLLYSQLVTYQYHASNNVSPPLSHWQTLTRDSFKIYKANPTPIPATPKKSSTTSTAVTSYDFKRSIKRDAGIYPELKDILHFNTWKVQFEALIAKDQLGHVIDSTYAPTPNTDEAITFRLQQDFVFSVFASKLKAAEAKQLVLKHVNDNDAQQVYIKLKQEAMKSARAQIERDKHSQFLNTKTLDSRWKGTQDGFIIYWMAELERYEQLTDVTLHYQPEQKKEKLQTAVRAQPNLRSVETMHRMMNIKGHHKIDYEAYLTLLRHAAQTYDSEQQKVGNPKYRLNKHIFSFDYCDHGNEMFDDLPSYGETPTHETFTEPVNNGSYLQNVARRDPRRIEDRPKIPQELWDKLDLAAKLWYCGRDKSEIDKIVANQSRNQSVQYTAIQELPIQATFHPHFSRSATSSSKHARNRGYNEPYGEWK